MQPAEHMTLQNPGRRVGKTSTVSAALRMPSYPERSLEAPTGASPGPATRDPETRRNRGLGGDVNTVGRISVGPCPSEPVTILALPSPKLTGRLVIRAPLQRSLP